MKKTEYAWKDAPHEFTYFLTLVLRGSRSLTLVNHQQSLIQREKLVKKTVYHLQEVQGQNPWDLLSACLSPPLPTLPSRFLMLFSPLYSQDGPCQDRGMCVWMSSVRAGQGEDLTGWGWLGYETLKELNELIHMYRKCVQTAIWTYILRDNLTFSNPHPQLETLSEEQIWTLLVPSALGAWKHSWGPAMCPRQGAPPGLKKAEVQNGPSGWYSTRPQTQPGTDLLSAGFINYFWCWLFFFF